MKLVKEKIGSLLKAKTTEQLIEEAYDLIEKLKNAGFEAEITESPFPYSRDENRIFKIQYYIVKRGSDTVLNAKSEDDAIEVMNTLKKYAIEKGETAENPAYYVRPMQYTRELNLEGLKDVEKDFGKYAHVQN